MFSSKKYGPDGTPVPGQQFDYSFDTIGNRTQTKAGGDQTGGNQRVAAYAANNLNQYTSRVYPGTNDVIGAALATNGVTVNGTAAWRKGEYFWATVKTNNTSSPAWLTTTVASGGITNTGHVYLPQTPEQFSYDADGNLTNDGRWAYTWDGENRLIGMTVNTNVGPVYQMTFAYDFQGRRIQKIVATNGVTYATNNFLYDGWNLVAEVRPDNTRIRTYVWGSDLSGSAQGAGGVGGLLEVSYYGASTTNAFVAYDGNGNVSALVNVADGTMLANYEYDPFGQTIRSTGLLAKNNPFRFSTKYQDDESDQIYYGYRFYNQSTGRWVSRDPIQEKGGLNTYACVRNDLIDLRDRLGLIDVDVWIWHWKGLGVTIGFCSGFVGHVMVIDAGTTGDTEVSQFPEKPGQSPRMWGPNINYNYSDTTKTESNDGTPKKFHVHLPNDSAFKTEVYNQTRVRQRWVWWPLTPDQTQCARAAYDVLKAGGLPLWGYPDGTEILPGNVYFKLERLAKQSENNPDNSWSVVPIQ